MKAFMVIMGLPAADWAKYWRIVKRFEKQGCRFRLFPPNYGYTDEFEMIDKEVDAWHEEQELLKAIKQPTADNKPKQRL